VALIGLGSVPSSLKAKLQSGSKVHKEFYKSLVTIVKNLLLRSHLTVTVAFGFVSIAKILLVPGTNVDVSTGLLKRISICSLPFASVLKPNGEI